MKLPPITELMSLRGRVALVTGGASGIGSAICFRLAELGATVCVSDRAVEAGARVADELRALFPALEATFLKCDLGVPEHVDTLCDSVTATHGRLDILINNAALFSGADSLAITAGQLAEAINVILKGPTVLASHAARHMAARGTGVIINVAIPPKALPNMAPYLAAKHGVLGMTKALALDCGPRGVRVLAVSPTLVDTPGMREKAEQLAKAGIDLFGDFAARLPLRRVGQPDDVARVIAFCASDLASFVTGTNVLVDGGDSLI